ncbi:glycosyl transferase [Flavobacterium sp. TP390]|uniref:Glycosyl transferase n=1 Tax=Flavobacterium profundi TaxID=1774945 RepID=A0A6I4IG37_9FLAO|nr:glycosyl transferase [Flavobacterium profundi]MVO08588.1 glycosyl transferase [Flavobacterium profundi]
MKKRNLLLLFLFSIVLFSCEGSDAYQGKWKAINRDDERFEITFTAKEITTKDSKRKTLKYEYSQNSIHYENGATAYGIQLSDGREYQLFFPKKDKSVGMLLDRDGRIVYTLSRNAYVNYDDIYKLD